MKESVHNLIGTTVKVSAFELAVAMLALIIGAVFALLAIEGPTAARIPASGTAAVLWIGCAILVWRQARAHAHARHARKGHAAALFDALVHGHGFTQDGKHVPLADVFRDPVADGHRIHERLVAEMRKHDVRPIRFNFEEPMGRVALTDLPTFPLRGEPVHALVAGPQSLERVLIERGTFDVPAVPDVRIPTLELPPLELPESPTFEQPSEGVTHVLKPRWHGPDDTFGVTVIDREPETVAALVDCRAPDDTTLGETTYVAVLGPQHDDRPGPDRFFADPAKQQRWETAKALAAEFGFFFPEARHDHADDPTTDQEVDAVQNIVLELDDRLGDLRDAFGDASPELWQAASFDLHDLMTSLGLDPQTVMHRDAQLAQRPPHVAEPDEDFPAAPDGAVLRDVVFVNDDGSVRFEGTVLADDHDRWSLDRRWPLRIVEGGRIVGVVPDPPKPPRLPPLREVTDHADPA